MFALKKFAAILFLTLTICATSVEAAEQPRAIFVNLSDWDKLIEENPDEEFLKAQRYLRSFGDQTADYILVCLVNSRRFALLEYDESILMSREFLSGSKRFEPKSDTKFGRAKEWAEYNKCDYLMYADLDGLYGNSFVWEPVFKNEKFQSLKATIIIHVLNVKNGRAFAVTGEGVAKRSDLESEDLKGLDKGQFPLDSFEIATAKAAQDAVEKIVKHFE